MTVVCQDIELQRRADGETVDGGRAAWLVLAACFILEGLVWGFPFAFGVFQQHYASHERFASDPAGIAAIGTTATGIMYFAAPLVYGTLRRYPRFRKPCAIVGYVILLAGLFGASFSTTLTGLLACQGALYGIGGALHYFPAFLYLEEWFVARKGLAYGIAWAGAGASGVVIPLTMGWVLSTYGYQTALRSWALFSVLLTVPALCFLRGRMPDRHADMGPQRIEFKFLRSPAFWILQSGNIATSLGYFMPSLYMPSFATSQGWSALSGTIAVSLCNGANIVGTILTGWVIDRYHVTTAINICTVGTVVAVFLFWSFAVHQSVLFVFAILYGVFAGGFTTTWAGCAIPIRLDDPAVETGMVIATFSAGKGVGSVIAGPLSGALVRSDSWRSHAGFAFGSGYGSLIVFSGITACFGSVGWVGKKCGLVKRK